MRINENHVSREQLAKYNESDNYRGETIADVAGYYVLQAICAKFIVEDDCQDKETLCVHLHGLASASFDYGLDSFNGGKRMDMDEFEKDTLIMMFMMACEMRPTDDLHERYLYHWAIKKGFELYLEVGNNIKLLLNMLHDVEFLNEDFLMPDNLIFNLSEMMTNENHNDFLHDMLRNSEVMAKRLLDCFENHKARQLFETERKVCALIFTMGRVWGNMSKGKLNALTMYHNIQDYKPELNLVFKRMRIDKEVNDFISAHYDECASIFGLGLLAENTRLNLGYQDIFEIAHIVENCKLMKDIWDAITGCEPTQPENKKIV